MTTAAREHAAGARPRLLQGGESAAASALQEFLEEASTAGALRIWFGEETFSRLAGEPQRALALLDRDIAAIDALIEAQLGVLLANPALRALEATWRGTHYLTEVFDKADRVKIRILNASWPEVVRDFERAAEFDQSVLFEMIYSQEFGRAGGEPFGLIVGDYSVSHRAPTDDVATLKSVAAMAAAAFAPFVCGCDPAVFGVEGFESLGADLDLESIFRHEEYSRWRGLRDVEDGRFVGLCLPRILLRAGWPADQFLAGEKSQRGDYNLWGNSAFALAAVAIRAFVQTGWFAEIRGVRRGEGGGGLVPGQPVAAFATDARPIAFKHPVEVAISDRQERRLGDLGFIPLSVAEYVPAAIFYSNQSLHRPRRYDDATSTANARLSSMLQYVMCVARFAHAVKMIGRERIASFTSASECQSLMQGWLSEYVTANANASLELRTKFPLREGRVIVRDDPARPGSLKLEMYLRPHLQFDDVSSGIRITSELTAPRAA